MGMLTSSGVRFSTPWYMMSPSHSPRSTLKSFRLSRGPNSDSFTADLAKGGSGSQGAGPRDAINGAEVYRCWAWLPRPGTLPAKVTWLLSSSASESDASPAAWFRSQSEMSSRWPRSGIFAVSTRLMGFDKDTGFARIAYLQKGEP